MSTLASLVQALPGELFNKIYDLTFTPNDSYHIDSSYKPPSCLQVSRSTRSMQTKEYYGSTFHIERRHFGQWLAPFTIERVRELQKVQILDMPVGNSAVWSDPGYYLLNYGALEDLLNSAHIGGDIVDGYEYHRRFFHVIQFGGAKGTMYDWRFRGVVGTIRPEATFRST